MKWKEALNIYYKKNKPDCYLPRKGTKHYNDVLAMVSEAPAKKSPAKKSPAKKKSNCALNNNQCKIIKGVFKDCL